MSAEQDNKTAALEQASAILGEHFEEFALCVCDRPYDSFRWCTSSEMMGKALFERGVEEMVNAREGLGIDWEYEFEEEEDDEEEW